MSEEFDLKGFEVEEKETVQAKKAPAKVKEVAPEATEELGAVGARARSIALKLGQNKPEFQGERAPSPMAQQRGSDIAAKFIARSAQRNG